MAPLIDETSSMTQMFHCSAPTPPTFTSPILQRKQKRKEVSFSVMSDLYLIPHVKDLNKHERDATYMTQQDFHRIQEENFVYPSRNDWWAFAK